MTKFYVSNYVQTIGQTYLILSIDEDESDYRVEKILLFPSSNDLRLDRSRRTAYPKSLFSIEDTINEEIRISKSDFEENYEKQLEKAHFTYNIEFKEDKASILHFLNNKFPEGLNTIKKITFHDELQNLISFYQTIKVSKIDFD